MSSLRVFGSMEVHDGSAQNVHGDRSGKPDESGELVHGELLGLRLAGIQVSDHMVKRLNFIYKTTIT